MDQKQVTQILFRGEPKNDDSDERWEEYLKALSEAGRLSEESAARTKQILADVLKLKISG